jgi:hypothetical protein
MNGEVNLPGGERHEYSSDEREGRVIGTIQQIHREVGDDVVAIVPPPDDLPPVED